MSCSAGALVDRLVASDPERARLRGAVRAWLTATIGAAVLLGVAHLLGQAPTLALIGVVIPLMSAVAVQDPTVAQQRTTMLLVPVVAAPAVWLGTWLHDAPLAAGAGFLLVIVAGFEGRRFGPRGVALGMIAYLAYFYALLLQPDQGSELAVLGFLLAGTAIAQGVRLLTPGRPARLLRTQLQALRARMALWLLALLRAIDAPHGKRGRRRVQRQLARLNAQSLALDGRLAQLPGQDDDDAPASILRDRVLHVELAAETLTSTVQAAVPDGLSQHALRDMLCALRQSVREGTPFDVAGFEASQAGPTDPDLSWRFWHAVRVIAEEPAWDAPLPESPQPARAPSATDGSAATSARRRWFALDEPTRQACQGAVAATGAGLAGYAIAPDHWYWAVFASFVVFTRASNVGQTLSQAWQRVLASVVGVALGLGLAEVVQGHTVLQVVLLYAFLAVGFYAFRGLQPVYTCLLTAMLAMLYELLGKDASGLLVTRLEDTLAGAVIAVASGLLVFPVRTQDHSDRESAALLRTAAGLLRDAFEGAQPPTRDAVRKLDRELQSLRAALGPVTDASYPARKSPHRHRLHQLTKLAYCLRHLYRLVANHAQELRDDAALTALAQQVGKRLCHTAALLAGEDAGAAPSHEDAKPIHGGERLRLAGHWLRQAEAIAGAMEAEASSA